MRGMRSRLARLSWRSRQINSPTRSRASTTACCSRSSHRRARISPSRVCSAISVKPASRSAMARPLRLRLPAEAVAPAAASAAVTAPAAVPAADGARIRISPFARKLAANMGVDYSALTGSGPSGRIVAKDILRCGRSAEVRSGGGSRCCPQPQLLRHLRRKRAASS